MSDLDLMIYVNTILALIVVAFLIKMFIEENIRKAKEIAEILKKCESEEKRTRMTEFLILTEEEIQKLNKNEPVHADIGRPIVLCSRKYFEQQREDSNDRTETDPHH